MNSLHTIYDFYDVTCMYWVTPPLYRYISITPGTQENFDGCTDFPILAMIMLRPGTFGSFPADYEISIHSANSVLILARVIVELHHFFSLQFLCKRK